MHRRIHLTDRQRRRLIFRDPPAPPRPYSPPNGFELYRGPSAIDGREIVVILVGWATGSTNTKTGAMLQTYILRTDADPMDTWVAGDDESICGDCPHRSPASGGAGSCYVNKGQGPRAVWYAWKRGNYPKLDPVTMARGIAARRAKLRIGTYGDPGALPVGWWSVLAAAARERTGYTHQWASRPDLRGWVMASVDSEEQAGAADALGWSWFRVAEKGDARRLAAEARCPASEEAGRRVSCEGCPMMCDGIATRPANRGRVIQAHGATAKRYALIQELVSA